MKVAIFSDLHMTLDASKRNRVFAELLGRLRTEGLTDLWLLGDIFDLLIGPYTFWAERHRHVWKELESCVQAGVRVLWIEGNHDFYFRSALERLGVEIVDGIVTRKVESREGLRRVYLAHGDLVNDKDLPYLKWRAFTRSFGFRFVTNLLPEALAERFLVPLGEKLSRDSRAREKYEPGLEKLYLDFAHARWQEGFDGVCLGHCHIRTLSADNGHFYLNTGSWLDGEFSYGWWDTLESSTPQFRKAT